MWYALNWKQQIDEQDDYVEEWAVLHKKIIISVERQINYVTARFVKKA